MEFEFALLFINIPKRLILNLCKGLLNKIVFKMSLAQHSILKWTFEWP